VPEVGNRSNALMDYGPKPQPRSIIVIHKGKVEVGEDQNGGNRQGALRVDERRLDLVSPAAPFMWNEILG
jgi:hypothetical protein